MRTSRATDPALDAHDWPMSASSSRHGNSDASALPVARELDDHTTVPNAAPVIGDRESIPGHASMRDATSAEPRSTDDWMAALYEELRKLAYARMRQQRANHTLQPTALLHEAYARMKRRRVRVTSRRHFFYKASQAMRDVLVEYARRRAAQRRGGHLERITCTTSLRDERESMTVEELLQLSRALEKMQMQNPDSARVVLLRFFGGLTVREIALTVGRSQRSISRDLRVAQAWLTGRLRPRTPGKRG